MIMLRSTHALLLELKGMQQQIQEDRAARAESALRRAEAVILDLKKLAREQRGQIGLLVKSNNEMTRDLIVVRGAGRVRQEKTVREEPEEMRPDVILQDETRQGLDKDHAAVEDARQKLEAMLEELGSQYGPAPDVSAEALEAATPNSLEDWEEEHAPMAT